MERAFGHDQIVAPLLQLQLVSVADVEPENVLQPMLRGKGASLRDPLGGEIVGVELRYPSSLHPGIFPAAGTASE
jgi:hypothetical protein